MAVFDSLETEMECGPMKRRNISFVAITLALLGGLFAPELAEARQQRMQVLLVPLNRAEPGRGNFGVDVCRSLQRHLDELDTHVSVPFRNMQDVMRRLRVGQEDLDCVTGRQLALQMNAELVFCGTWDPQPDNTTVVKSLFQQVQTGEVFEVPAVTAGNAADAAAQVFQAFHTYTRQLEHTAFCQEYLASGQWAEARSNCLIALELNPQSLTAHQSLARALLEMDSLERSLQVYRQVLEMTNFINDDALLTAGIVATRLGYREEAGKYFGLYLEINPGDINVRLTIASDVAAEGDALGALQLVEAGIRLEPDSLSLKQFAGHFAMQAAQDVLARQPGGQEDLDPEAAELLEKALGYYMVIFDAHGADTETRMLTNMLGTLNLLRRPEDAVSLGARIVAAKPDEARLWSIYADALNRVGRIDEALAALDSVAAREPDYDRVAARRGQWLLQQGRVDDAKAAFRRAVERTEIMTDDVANNIFAVAYRKQQANEYDDALRIYAAADEFAVDPHTKGMIAFFRGSIRYSQATRMVEPEMTVEAARRALPVFREALGFFRQSGPYAASNPQAAAQVQQHTENTERYIEIAEILIRRGR